MYKDKLVLSYIRVSTKDQDTSRQYTNIKAWSTAQRILVDEFLDR